MNGLLGFTDAAAVSATDAALTEAAARPFSVVLSVDDATKAWITGLLVGGALLGVILHKRRG